MTSTILYLLKSCVYVAAFYIPFLLILRRTTFFGLNRTYLVVGLLLSLALPLYRVTTPISSYSPGELSFVEPIVAQTERVISQASVPSGSFDLIVVLSIIYAIGIAVRLTVLVFSISGILKLKRQGEKIPYEDLNVFKTNTSVPFTFFSYIFFPGDVDDQSILVHEAAHVRQYHWMDLLILEFVSILLWFNPLMIVYKRSLKQQHEYLADQAVIKGGIGVEEYLTGIVRQLELTVSLPMTSEFYFLSIKNRISMLTRKRTSIYAFPMYSIALPLIICLLMAFSPNEHFNVMKPEAIAFSQEQISLGLPIDKKNNYSFHTGYGDRMHPVLGVMRLHTGIDLVAKEGVPVVSTQNGIVLKAKSEGAWGNIIIIQHDDTYTTSYSHLKLMSVKEGDTVQKGQEIGLVGHTGLTTTDDHLHFELLKNGKAVDPIGYLPEIKN